MRMGVSEVVQLLGAAIVFPWKRTACQSATVPEFQSSRVPPAIHRSIFCPNPRHGSKPFYSPSSSWPTGSMCQWSDCVERRLALGVPRSSGHSGHSAHSGHPRHCPQPHPRLLRAHSQNPNGAQTTCTRPTRTQINRLRSSSSLNECCLQPCTMRTQP